MRKRWLALVAVVGASSCGLQVHDWVRDGSTRVDMQRDLAACDLEARRAVPDAPRISSPPPQPVQDTVTTYDGMVGNQRFYGTATQQAQPQVQRTWQNDFADQMAADTRVRDSRSRFADTCMRAKGYRWEPVQGQNQPRVGIDPGGAGGCPYGMWRSSDTGLCRNP